MRVVPIDLMQVMWRLSWARWNILQAGARSLDTGVPDNSMIEESYLILGAYMVKREKDQCPEIKWMAKVEEDPLKVIQ
jgi:hypothetical protein